MTFKHYAAISGSYEQHYLSRSFRPTILTFFLQQNGRSQNIWWNWGGVLLCGGPYMVIYIMTMCCSTKKRFGLLILPGCD